MIKFWCCFVEGTGGFSRKHQTEGDAMIEAERLARMPGNRDKKCMCLRLFCFVRRNVRQYRGMK